MTEIKSRQLWECQHGNQRWEHYNQHNAPEILGVSFDVKYGPIDCDCSKADGIFHAVGPLNLCSGVVDDNGVELYEDDIVELYEGSRYRLAYQPRWGGFELVGLYDRETLGDKTSDWSAVFIGTYTQEPHLLQEVKS